MNIINSSQISIRGRNTFNYVHGNQFNQTISGGVIHVHGSAAHTISDEFEYVKRGHIIGMKDLGSVDLSEWDWHWHNGELFRQLRKSVRKMVSTVKIYPDRDSKFTVLTYEGGDAHEAWEDDFQQFSRAGRTGSFQLFGKNRSDFPMLIFHHELIPVAHFYTGSLWMNIYIDCLRKSKRCGWDTLWLNTSSGVLCDGPAGPRFLILDLEKNVTQDVPSTVDMLEEEPFLRFFSKFGASMDCCLLECALKVFEGTYLDDLVPYIMEDNHVEDNIRPDSKTTHYPYLKGLWQSPPRHLPIDVIGRLRFDTIYSPLLEPVARWPEASRLWKWADVDGLAKETWLDDELTRFELTGREKQVSVRARFDWQTFWKGWLSQYSCVFDALKMTEHRNNFFFVDPPWPRLQSALRECNTYDPCDSVEETPPIYLFLCPPPMTISELVSWMGGRTHFWAFDETGQSRIPEEGTFRNSFWIWILLGCSHGPPTPTLPSAIGKLPETLTPILLIGHEGWAIQSLR